VSLKIFFVAATLLMALLARASFFRGHTPTPSMEQDTGITAANSAHTIHVEGELNAGEAFEKAIGRDLVFRLSPSREPRISGWTIEIHPNGQTPGEYTEFAYVVTPPYRSSNARYLDTAYGISAKEAVAWTPRTFYFVLDRNEYKSAGDALDKTLWPGNYSDAEVDAAGKVLDELPKGEGELRIVNSRISEGKGDKESGKIEWLKFAVDLKFPPAKEAR
jgi:hypothetical protein